MMWNRHSQYVSSDNNKIREHASSKCVFVNILGCETNETPDGQPDRLASF